MNEWKDICLILESLLDWLKIKKSQITTMKLQCVADAALLEQQKNQHQMHLMELDAKKSVILSSIATAKSTAASQAGCYVTRDASSHILSDPTNNQVVLKNMQKLASNLEEEWDSVQRRSSQLEHQINQLLPSVYELQDQVESCREMLKNLEITRDTWQNVGDLPTEILQDHIIEMKHFQTTALQPMSNRLAKLDLHVKNLKGLNMGVPSHALNKVDEILMRWKLLQVCCSERIRQLLDAARDFGPNSQHFLTSSVDEPWERFVSENQVPFYVNHFKKMSTWDHPKMTELMESLYDLNNIKLAAYRTAMKIRRLQKALCLDLLPLETATEVFKQHKVCSADKSFVVNNTIGVLDVISCLTTMYDCLERHHNSIVNVPLCVDMCLNWILNVYDIKRKGTIKSLAFKLGIVSLCDADLESKCRYIFSQVAASTGLLDEKGLSDMIGSFLKIAWQLGESKAFGGCDATASMLSCHQFVGNKPELDIIHFINWMKIRPQSLVWLCVFHRLAASENISHPVRCAICREFPIVGIRFRSLRHFNYDICQSCFFSGAVVHRNLLHYPMAEHCVPATSVEKIKDFAKVIKNKFKGKTSKKYIGYLPVHAEVEENVKLLNESEVSAELPATNDYGKTEMTQPSANHCFSDFGTVDAHTQIQEYASRLAFFENDIAMNSLDDKTADEHHLILQYCKAEGLNPKIAVSTGLPHQQTVLFSHKNDEVPFSGGYISSSGYASPPPLPRSVEHGTLHTVDYPLNQECDVSGEHSNHVLKACVPTSLQAHASGRYETEVQLLEDHNKIIRDQLNELRVLIQEDDVTPPTPMGHAQHTPLFFTASTYINELLKTAESFPQALET